MRGFVSDDLIEAFHQADAIARGTCCKNNLFSLSLNPPEAFTAARRDSSEQRAALSSMRTIEAELVIRTPGGLIGSGWPQRSAVFADKGQERFHVSRVRQRHAISSAAFYAWRRKYGGA